MVKLSIENFYLICIFLFYGTKIVNIAGIIEENQQINAIEIEI